MPFLENIEVQMNNEFEPKPAETEAWKAKKFDFEEFDPKPLEPEDLEEMPLNLTGGTKRSLNIEALEPEKPKVEKLKVEKTAEEQISGLRTAVTAFSLVGQVGLIMFASVAIGLFGGMYLDRWLGTEPILLIVLIIVGVVSGFRTVYMMIKKLIK